MRAYDMQEVLEKSAQRLGHSPLNRSKELTAMQSHMIDNGEKGNAVMLADMLQPVNYASKDSTQNVHTIRAQLRVLRRLSTAVCDQATPAYLDSGLCYCAS